eukprot:scaffold110992_cov34-Tisochrysis_lutea.AAC.1
MADRSWRNNIPEQIRDKLASTNTRGKANVHLSFGLISHSSPVFIPQHTGYRRGTIPRKGGNSTEGWERPEGGTSERERGKILPKGERGRGKYRNNTNAPVLNGTSTGRLARGGWRWSLEFEWAECAVTR